MRLSKVYRIQDSATLPLQFASFDADGGNTAPCYQSSHQFRTLTMSEENAAPPQPSVQQDGDATEVAPVINEAPVVAASAPVDTRPQFEQARQQGYEEGLRAGQAKLDQTAQALADALTEVAQLRESILHNSRSDMLRLSVVIAEQVLQQQLKTDPEAILPIVTRALQASVQSDSYQVRVHPDDLEILNDNKPLFLASLSTVKKLTFEADPSLSPGGCQILSELGEVDATLETQIEEIRNALTEVMGEV